MSDTGLSFLSDDHLAQLDAVLSERGLTRRAYSGRGMFGKHCVSVSGQWSSIAEALCAFVGDVYHEIVEEAIDWDDEVDGDGTNHPTVTCHTHSQMVELLFSKQSMDSMGLDVVVYWPSWPWIAR